MIENTINDDRTVAGGGKGMIRAGRYHIRRQLGAERCEMRFGEESAERWYNMRQ